MDAAVTSIGAFEAKTHFSRLLERVAKGEQIVITKHGVPIARLVPFAKSDPDRRRRAIERLKSFREGQSLDGLSWRDLRDEGRR